MLSWVFSHSLFIRTLSGDGKPKVLLVQMERGVIWIETIKSMPVLWNTNLELGYHDIKVTHVQIEILNNSSLFDNEVTSLPLDSTNSKVSDKYWIHRNW